MIPNASLSPALALFIISDVTMGFSVGTADAGLPIEAGVSAEMILLSATLSVIAMVFLRQGTGRSIQIGREKDKSFSRPWTSRALVGVTASSLCLS